MRKKTKKAPAKRRGAASRGKKNAAAKPSATRSRKAKAAGRSARSSSASMKMSSRTSPRATARHGRDDQEGARERGGPRVNDRNESPREEPNHEAESPKIYGKKRMVQSREDAQGDHIKVVRTQGRKNHQSRNGRRESDAA